ncbi:AbiH family protein [Vagococcus fluvialis]|uniref:AbiH family protein n=1 Tax=Vagococcus fluvialis TaxID=2738 RepID=UPI003D0C5138
MANVRNFLVLGNGFDLSCKLPSSYSDYYSKRYKDGVIELFDYDQFLKSIPYNYGIKEAIRGYGFLDFVLLSFSNKNLDKMQWADIESIILKIFDEEEDFGIKKLSEVFVRDYSSTGKYPSFFNVDMNDYIFNHVTSKKITSLPIELKQEALFALLIQKGILTIYLKDALVVEQILLKAFDENLKMIESDFKEYIQSNVEDELLYYNLNAKMIFNELLLDLRSSFDNSDKLNLESTYVLTFNYSYSELSDRFYDYNHVHGRMATSNDIIFGVDENALSSDSPYFPYTKTYRKLLLDTLNKDKSKKLPTKIKKLAFYGHSLGEADYSYFYSIFDHYDIYNSQIEIIFYYCDYLMDERQSVLREYVSNISKLFTNYSENSKFTTKNLLHKLNLEGRIIIKEIKIDYTQKGSIEKASI